MTPERKARLKAIRQRLANLTQSERQALASRGILATVEVRNLSVTNTILVYLQSNGRNSSIVGGYQQWRKAGRQVKRGERGMVIWFPVGRKDEDTGDLLESPDKFFTATVFDISQTEAIGESPAPAKPEPVPCTPADNNIMEGWKLV